MRYAFLLLALGCAACDDGGAVDDVDALPPDMGGMLDMAMDDGLAPIAYDNPPVPDFTALPFPRTPDGAVFMTHNAGFTLLVDPARITPAARAGRCVRTFIACLDAPDASPDACMRSTPRCADPAYVDPQTPLCCPADCEGTYQQARAAGATPEEALKTAILSADGCIPGLGEVL
jgi:hypothetical protein